MRGNFFFNDTATTEIYTLSLHDALPISLAGRLWVNEGDTVKFGQFPEAQLRSEEHTSELQSQSNLVCRLLLEKKKNNQGSSGSCGINNSSTILPSYDVLMSSIWSPRCAQ